MKTRFIGDIHGNVREYHNLIDNIPSGKSVQVGDFGMGFISKEDENFFFTNKNHGFIRGNHDDPAICKKHPCWIPDGTIKNDVMFVGGGWSIDWQYRIPGISWWEDEELTSEELYIMIDRYIESKPRVMVTHEAPAQVIQPLFPDEYKMAFAPSRTSRAFEAMFNNHQPEIWIFGHWHKNRNQIINGTRFICLAELTYIDLEVDI